MEDPDLLYPEASDRTDPFLWAALLVTSLGLAVISLKRKEQ